jgi:glycosyltransferase 2 family protein
LEKSQQFIIIMLKQKRFWLGVLVSLALLAYLFYQTNLFSIGAVLSRANYFYLLPALALYFIGVGVRAVRWHFLLRSIKPVPARALFPVVVIGYMANDILPFRLGELVRAFVLGQEQQLSTASVLVTIVVERLFDGLTMIAFIAGASLVLPLDPTLKTTVVIVGSLLVAVIVVLIFVASLRERLDRVILFVLSRLPAHWGDRAARLIDSFLHGLSVLRNPVDALAAFACSLVAWLFEAGMYMTLALGFGALLPEIQSRLMAIGAVATSALIPLKSYAVFVLMTSFANLVAVAPSTPGYIGVLDAPIKGTLKLFGVDDNLAAAYTIVLHLALVIPVTLLGFFYAWRAGFSLAQLARPASVSAEPSG